jgi:hypothetical protein
LLITCQECNLKIHRNCPSMIHSGMICFSKSLDLTSGMQILSILWLQDMYHQEKIKESSSMRVVSTYGMIHTSLECARTGCSEDVYQLKKESKSLNVVTHHPMEDTMGHSEHIQRFSRVDSFGQPCMKTRRTLSEDADCVRSMATSIQEMPCRSLTTSISSYLIAGVLIT